MSNKSNFLSAVSVAALLAMTGLAVGQSAGGGPAGQGAGGGAAQRSDNPAPGGAMRNDSAPAQPGAMQNGAPNKESSAPGSTMKQDDRNAQSPADKPSKGTAQSKDGKNAQPSPTAQGKEQPADSKMGQKADDKKDDGKASTTVGSAPASIPPEQKTKIRESALGSNAPRVSSVNFSINVGTVVPSTVRIVEVPTTIIEIHPEWRGYRYFVVNDEIIIVEPRSLKIIAVLNI